MDMQGTNVITFSNNKISSTPKQPVSTRAISYKIIASTSNFSQYLNTVNAYALAEMPFEHIANAGKDIGDKVEKSEVDALVQQGWQNKKGEVVQNDQKILAWQQRGTVPVNRQLSYPSTTGEEIVIVSGQQDGTIEVVEGISVLKQDRSELENNSYLQPQQIFNQQLNP